MFYKDKKTKIVPLVQKFMQLTMYNKPIILAHRDYFFEMFQNRILLLLVIQPFGQTTQTACGTALYLIDLKLTFWFGASSYGFAKPIVANGLCQ